MKAGIVGLSLVGKSTLFQLLTGAESPPPGSRPEARLGVARVPDPRVETLAGIFKPKKKTWATVEYVDVPGVKRGEGSALVDLPALRGVSGRVFGLAAVPTVGTAIEGRIDGATADRSNAGTSMGETTSSANTRPRASPNDTVSQPRGASRRCC